MVWGWATVAPFAPPDPLRLNVVSFDAITIAVPKPSRYSLVLLLNDDEAAQRSMWIGPTKASLPPGSQ